jgi:hypothetical protein
VRRVVESFEHCTTFDDRRQFLVEHVERIIYDHYRVTVIGSVPIKMQLSNSQEIENANIANRVYCSNRRLTTVQLTQSHCMTLPMPKIQLAHLIRQMA